MNQKKLQEVREYILNFEHSWGEGVKYRAKTLIDCLKHFRPDLNVWEWESDVEKHTRASGMPYYTGGGTREYKSYSIKVSTKDGERIFEHDTAETYRQNYEIVEKIKPLLEEGE